MNIAYRACLREKQSELKTGHRKEVFAAAKDHRNGQFSGVERHSLNPAQSFLLLESTLSNPPAAEVSKGAVKNREKSNSLTLVHV